MPFVKGTKAPRARYRERHQGVVPVSMTYKFPFWPDMTPMVIPFGPEADVYVGNSYERIEDVVGGIASWQNPCVHEKITVRMDTSAITGIFVNPLNSSEISLSTMPSFVPRNAIHACCGLPSAGDVSEASLWARTRSIAAVDESVDLFAFIGELLDVLDTAFKKCKTLIDWVESLRQRMLRLYHEYRKRRPDLNDIACWHLAWKFGVEPFLSDLLKLARSVTNASQRLKWLQDRNGIPTYVKNRKKLSCESSPPFVAVDGGLVGAGGSTDLVQGYKVVCKSSEAIFASTQCVRFRIPSEFLEGFPGLGIVWLTSMGIYNPVASAWELTRFSWLIDWFVGYRNRITTRLLTFTPLGDAEYLASVSSIRTTHTGSIYWIHGESGAPLETFIGEFQMDNYQRIPGDFTVDNAPQFRLPLAFGQWLIALSLGVQSFWKRKK